jgi:hypothetical protein
MKRDRSPVAILLVPGWIGLLGLLGCGTTSAVQASAPEGTVAAYADAVQAGKYARAYGLMSLAFRKRYAEQDFVRMLQEHSRELPAAMQQLRAKATQVEVEAKLELSETEHLRLVLENGIWKIASDPVDFYGQRTPAEALRSFVHALDRRRYDIVLRFVPAKWSDAMTVEKLRKEWEGDRKDEVGNLIKNLKANLNAPIHQTGDTATMPYGEKYEVRFVREDGVWKIEDPD